MHTTNNISFKANMKFIPYDNNNYENKRWEDIQDQFNNDTKGKRDDITLTIHECESNYYRSLLIKKECKSNKFEDCTLYLNMPLYSNLLCLDDYKIVDKFKKIADLSDEQKDLVEDSNEFLKKHPLKNESLYLFNNAIRTEILNNMKDKFKDDDILKNIHVSE